jgi:peptidoglycan/LPS O-acetylase OafA/YrhL
VNAHVDMAPNVEHGPAESNAAPIAINQHLSHWIDLFRWTSALLVVIAHAGNRFVQAVDTVPHSQRTYSQYAYAFAMGFSHTGIMIFFVISGFLVGGTAWRESSRTGGIDLRRFLGRRLVRLWIVIVPALAATLLFDTIGVAQGGAAQEIYAHARALGPGAALCNLLFTQTVACDPYGTDGALWTLYNEFWYYLIFVAGLMLMLGRRYSPIVRVALVVFIVVVVFASSAQREGAPLVPYFAVWLVGAWAAAASRAPVRLSPWVIGVTLLLLLLGFRIGLGVKLWSNNGIGPYLFDLVSMTVFGLFLVQMRFHPVPLPSWLARPSVFLASFTFTLYCFHVPLMNLMAALMERYLKFGWRDVSAGSEWLRLIGQLGFVLLVTYLLSRATEARTDKLRQFLIKGRTTAFGFRPNRRM